MFTIQVLVQYGKSRKALVVEKPFVETIKKEFEIDEKIIVQKFDHVWEGYVDINSMTVVEDRSKLSVILKKKVLMKFIIFYKKIKALCSKFSWKIVPRVPCQLQNRMHD